MMDADEVLETVDVIEIFRGCRLPLDLALGGDVVVKMDAASFVYLLCIFFSSVTPLNLQFLYLYMYAATLFP